jgi:hypothetical protein
LKVQANSVADCGCQDEKQNEPLACSLTPGDRTKRQRWLRDLTGRALAVTRSDDGMTATFPLDAELEDELRTLAAAEAECCPFLDIAVRRAGDAVVLDVVGPPDARPIIEEMLG